MIAHNKDLFLSQEVTTAITEPRLIPVCVTVFVTLLAVSGSEVLWAAMIETASNTNVKVRIFLVMNC